MHTAPARKNRNFAQKAMIVAIKGYRLVLSPWVGQQCRFYPSCSQYTESAIEYYGALRGLGLGIWRILRCNPCHPGGYEPLPYQQKIKNHDQ